METGENEEDAELGPVSTVHSLASEFSEKGLTDWCIKLIKSFNLGPKKGSTGSGKAGAKVGAKRKATGSPGEDDDDDDGNEGEGEEEPEEREEVQEPPPRAKAKAKKPKSRKTHA